MAYVVQHLLAMWEEQLDDLLKASGGGESASGEESSQVLVRWRTSRFDLLRVAYQALTQLIQASWYDNPTSGSVIGYPGPPMLGVR